MHLMSRETPALSTCACQSKALQVDLALEARFSQRAASQGVLRQIVCEGGANHNNTLTLNPTQPLNT